MAALENLSIAANILQVIGFHADTVFCVGQTLYELIDKARLASQTIALLLRQLQALLSVVALVKIVIDEHQHSPFAHEDGHGLPNIQTLLSLIEQDFRHLKDMLDSTTGPSGLRWLSNFQTSFWWVLKDRDVADARQRLSQYTQQLSVALSAVGRRNDVVFRNKLQSIEDKLHAISQSRVTDGSTFGVVARPARHKSIVHTPKRPKKVSFQRKDCQKKPNKSYHHTSSAPFELTNNEVNDPELSIYEQADNTLVVETGLYGLGHFAKALFLLRDTFMACLGDRMNRVLGISKTQADHLVMIFDFLVASAHQSSAQAILNKYRDAKNAAPFLRQMEPDIMEFWKDQYHDARETNDHKETKPALYLLEEKATMETSIGVVHARILSARSSKATKTVAFDMHYTGYPRLALSPFTIKYMSHTAIDYAALQSQYQSLALPSFAAGSMYLPADDRSTKHSRLLWIPKQFCGTAEAFHGFLSSLSDDLDLPEIASMRLKTKARYARLSPGKAVFYST